MAREDILDLAAFFALQLEDADQVGNYLTQEIRTLGQQLILTNMSAQNVTGGTRTYTTPAEAVMLLRVFAGERELLPHSMRELEAVDRDWRLQSGDPRVYTVEDEAENFFTLYPTPNLSVAPVSGSFQDAFGASFLPGQLSLLFTEERVTVPDWLTLYLTLTTLSREFLRESNHRDIPFAGAAAALAEIVKKMVL
jgi:hypothetical protein